MTNPPYREIDGARRPEPFEKQGCITHALELVERSSAELGNWRRFTVLLCRPLGKRKCGFVPAGGHGKLKRELVKKTAEAA